MKVGSPGGNRRESRHLPPPRIAWTGHRPQYFAEPAAAEQVIGQTAQQLQESFGGRLHFATGGQLGVDLWAATAARDLGIPYDVCLPLPLDEFTAGWAPPDRRRLASLVDDAAARWIAPPSEDRYGARNQRLIDGAAQLEAVWTGLEQGGTWDTIRRAVAAGVPVRFHRFQPSGVAPRPGVRGV